MKCHASYLVHATWAALALSALLSGCSKTPISQRYDWPRWRGPDGNGISRETGWNPKALEGGPRVFWKADIGSGFSNVAIRANLVYTMGWGPGPGNFVYCLDALTGRVLWRHQYLSSSFPQATPAVTESQVYCLSYEGLLFCLDAENGKLRWEKDLVAEYGAVRPYYGFSGSPEVEGDLLILTANTAGMAVDKNTGAKVWGSVKYSEVKKRPQFSDDRGVAYTTPTLYGTREKRRALICSWEGLHSVDVKTGLVEWIKDWQDTYEVNGGQDADPHIFDNKVFMVQSFSGSLGGTLFEVSGKTPKVLWTNKELASQLASPLLLDGRLYVGQGGSTNNGPGAKPNALHCLDAASGKILWTEELEKEPVCFTAADGKLILLSENGTLAIAEGTAAGYREISRCDVLAGEKKPRKFWTPPVLCNGRVYCRNFAGDLVCIDLSR